jgi:hypothetical protein
VLVAAGLAQGGAVLIGQRGQVGAGWADAERVGLPPVLERVVANADGQRGGVRASQSSLGEQPGQVAFAGARPTGLVVHGWVQFPRRLPERADRAALAAVVPHAGGHRPARRGHPAHLAQARHRVGHEVDHELGQGDVEAAVGEGQLLGRRLADIHPRQPLPDRRGERR